ACFQPFHERLVILAARGLLGGFPGATTGVERAPRHGGTPWRWGRGKSVAGGMTAVQRWATARPSQPVLCRGLERTSSRVSSRVAALGRGRWVGMYLAVRGCQMNFADLDRPAPGPSCGGHFL